MTSLTDLTLHVGLQKTGTTLIQRSLRKIRPELSKRGVVYVDRKQFLTMKNIRGWSAFSATKPKRRAAFMGELRAVVEERVRSQLGQGHPAPSHVLISNEAMVGTNSPSYTRPFRPKAEEAIGDVVEALDPGSTRIVLYVRRQDRLIESAYMQRIHAGRAYSFEKYLDRIEQGPVIDFGDLVDRLAALPTVESVTTRPFEIIGAGHVAFIADFLDLVGVEGIDLSGLPDLGRSNPSYTAAALEAALTINRFVTRPADRKEVRRFLKNTFPVDAYEPARLFDDAQRQKCLDVYAATNERFFRRFHPDVDPDVYASPERSAKLSTYLTDGGRQSH